MKRAIKYLAIASAALAFLAACTKEKSETSAYVPATPESGAQVFFKDAPAAGTTVKLAKATPSLNITLGRASADALDVPIAAVGEDALKYFNVPATVSFAEDQKEAILTISAKDVNAMPLNEFFPIIISIDEESLVTAYGSSEISFQVGVSLPWIEFDKGAVLYEGWNEEDEPDKTMKYQQLSENMRYCVVEDCFGNGVPYVWYWNTETNYCYVPAQPVGKSYGDDGDAYVSDEAAFYNLYWNKQSPGKNGSGLEQGTDEWFAWHDARRAAWAPDGDPFPYYDGDGRFYLGDWYYLMLNGEPTGRGWQFGGTQDTFTCSFASDYSISFVYNGLLTDEDGIVSASASVTFEGDDVASVAVALVPGSNPNDAATLISSVEDPEEAPDNYLLLEESGSFTIALPELSEEYVILAAPISAEGEIVWDNALYNVIAYKDLSVILSAGDPVVNEDGVTGTVTATVTMGADVNYTLITMVPDSETASEDVLTAFKAELEKEIDEAPAEGIYKLLRSKSVDITIPAEGKYNLYAVSVYNGSIINTDAQQIEFVIVSPWEVAGTATWTDAFLAPWFGEVTPSYEVVLEKNNKVEGLYRLVNVYGAANPYNQEGDWDATKDYYLILHAENPKEVYFETFDSGCDWGYGNFCLRYIAYGALEGNVVTFPVQAIVKSMTGYNNGAWYYGNSDAEWSITLNLSSGEPEPTALKIVSSSRVLVQAQQVDVAKTAVTIAKGAFHRAGSKNAEISLTSERF